MNPTKSDLTSNTSPKEGGATPFYLQDELNCLLTVDGVGREEKRKCLATIQARQTFVLTASLEREKNLGRALEMALEAQNILSRILHSLEARGVKLSSAIQYRWGKSTELEQIARALLSTQGGPTT